MESLISQLIRIESFHTAADGEASLSIVIADDEERILHLLSVSLKALGHEVVGVATNGRQAVEMVNLHNPDLVILDIEMPEMDGLEAAAKILSQQSVPIIVSTGRTDKEALKRAREVEISGYIAKPFTKAQLKSTLCMACAQHLAMLQARVKIARLTSEIESVKAVDEAAALLMEKFRIDRVEAVEKLEMAAGARSCSLADAARAISVSLRPREAVPA